MANKRTKFLSILAIILIVVAIIEATYAYFQAQGGTTVTRNVNVTTHTVDTLTFSVDDNIEIEAHQGNFTSGGNNLSDEAVATAVLTPNSKTGAATKNYYVYLLLTNNGIVYSNANTNSDPELLLQVFDGSNNLVTLTGLGTQKTVAGLTGYDITTRIGLFALLNNHEITASNNQATTENWRVIVTLINHSFDQYENTGKQVTGSLVVSETATTYCDLIPDDDLCSLTLAYDPAINPTVLANGYLYYHDSTLTNGAKDYSWRYAGTDPNNYVCFGTNTCSDTVNRDNLYRIIGKIPVDVVVNENTNPVTTQKKVLYKIIKNDYENMSSLGMISEGVAPKISSFAGPEGNQPDGDTRGFDWSSGSSTNNTWSESSLNTMGLNTNVYDSFNSTWQNKIAKVMWKVGGNKDGNIKNATPMSTVYTNEITNPVTTNTTDGKTELVGKIGMMYSSDYGYAAPQSSWNTSLTYYSNSSIRSNNWLYKGVREWTLTRRATGGGAFFFDTDGGMSIAGVGNDFAVRRTFYLTENTTIDMANHAGTISDPYVINCLNCHTVTFNLDGGTGLTSQMVAHNETIKVSTDPVKTDYGFIGWKLNGVTYNPSTPVTEDITLTAEWIYMGTGFLYHHVTTLPFGANDGSYRYAGANPNNYVCFGSDASTCPDDNIYRIIGLIPVDVVTDETNPDNPVTQSQMLYKIIKNNYETTTSLGMSGGSVASKTGSFAGPTGNQPSGDVQGFYWNGIGYNSGNMRNTWSISTLNTTGYNTNVYNGFSSTWQNRIAKVIWKVGGNLYANIASKKPISIVYENEIINPVTTNTTDGKTELVGKIGMMYSSDYGYATLSSNWNIELNSYSNSSIKANNWLYKGVREWTLTRSSSDNGGAYFVDHGGNLSVGSVNNSCGVRQVFYLTQNTTIDMTNHAGTLADPYRVS